MNRVVVVESDKWNKGPSIQCTNAKKKPQKKASNVTSQGGEKEEQGRCETAIIQNDVSIFDTQEQQQQQDFDRSPSRENSYSDHRHCP